jgi:hypothetical protein
VFLDLGEITPIEFSEEWETGKVYLKPENALKPARKRG